MQIELLALSAAGIGLLHTLAGPDHYVPFAALAAARRWSTRRTLLVTAGCGLAHVAASIALGLLAVALGWSAARVLGVDEFRGDVTAWLLIGLGLAYLLYGLKRASRARMHSHEHVHGDGTRHAHSHDHAAAHLHPHVHTGVGVTAVWSLFVIFLFGPCEPLIPLVLAPAGQGDWLGLAIVCAAFTVATLGSMLVAVLLLVRGARTLLTEGVVRYGHAAAGVMIACCGVAIMLGL
jgi:sulfite exporter TauE/SafE